MFSTRFLFQNLDRVIIFDNDFNLIGDTDTLDLDPRSFSQRLDVIEMDVLGKDVELKKKTQTPTKKNEFLSLNEVLLNYVNSNELGKPYTFTQESYNQFLLITIKNVITENKTIGYLAITENAVDIKAAINERKSFIIRTALFVAIVIFIFSFVLNRYFLKPIKNLQTYTHIIREKVIKKLILKL